MTRQQYETTIKTITETANELMYKATSEKERMNILAIQNLQIQSVTDEYMRENV